MHVLDFPTKVEGTVEVEVPCSLIQFHFATGIYHTDILFTQSSNLQ